MNIRAKKWNKPSPPKKILAIRLQAMGDTIITLPYLQQVRNSLPANTRLDFLTRKEVENIPRNIELFDKVFSIGGERDLKRQMIHCISLLPRLWMQGYDMVLDLQNNEISRLVRRMLFPSAWSEFDRFSPIPAGERTRLTIEAAGLTPNYIEPGFKLKDHWDGIMLLKENGWNWEDLVILNPAGAFETRNWDINNYVQFASLWLNRFPSTKFLVMGTGKIATKAAWFHEKLGDCLINLVDKTTPIEAFSIMQKVKFILTEDSGMMHMAWVSGVPTLALFGSTRSDWSRPLGEKSLLLDSSDLPCGNCMQEKCKYGDTRCLGRYSPEFVFEKSLSLISHSPSIQIVS